MRDLVCLYFSASIKHEIWNVTFLVFNSEDCPLSPVTWKGEKETILSLLLKISAITTIVFTVFVSVPKWKVETAPDSERGVFGGKGWYNVLMGSKKNSREKIYLAQNEKIITHENSVVLSLIRFQIGGANDEFVAWKWGFSSSRLMFVYCFALTSSPLSTPKTNIYMGNMSVETILLWWRILERTEGLV